MEKDMEDEEKLIALHELVESMPVKEAFYSCQIEGINEGVKFEDWYAKYLKETRKPNKWKQSHEEIAEHLEGETKYIGEYYTYYNKRVISVFHNSNPNKEKGHREYPFLFVDEDGRTNISAYHADQWKSTVKKEIK
jgi:hypothetical protein